jgi:hypothetical protein
MHFVATIGRNDACPCGSGKKYKKCCLPVQEAENAALRAQVARDAIPPLVIDDDGLDELSNSVVDLANAGRFDDALAACKQLLDEFPEVVDGLERSAMVHEKMGHHALAADLYRKALAFIEQPHQRDGFDPDVFDDLREQIANNDALASAHGETTRSS